MLIRLMTIVLFLNLSLSSLCLADNLVFAIDVIRHGDRTPIENIPTVQHEWPEGLGQLTPRGMKQEYALGQHLRNVYVDKYSLLPSKYTAGTMYVRSSDFDRTLMSAQSLLFGLYPLGTGPSLPQGFQPIPVHTIPQNQDVLLITDNSSKASEPLLVNYIRHNKEWQQKDAALKPHYAAWARALGIDINGLRQLTSVSDLLYIDQLYHVPAPQGLSQAEVDTIIETGRWASATLYKSQQIGKIMGGHLLNEINARFQEAAKHPSSLKYVLYSAHDSTLMAQMSAMRVPLNEVPHYASHLSFMLFKTSDNQFYVKVLYNDHSVKIPSCGDDQCTLRQFAKLLSV